MAFPFFALSGSAVSGSGREAQNAGGSVGGRLTGDTGNAGRLATLIHSLGR